MSVLLPKTSTLDGRELEKKLKLKYTNNSIRFLKGVSYFVGDIVIMKGVVIVKHVLHLNWKCKLTILVTI